MFLYEVLHLMEKDKLLTSKDSAQGHALKAAFLHNVLVFISFTETSEESKILLQW